MVMRNMVRQFALPIEIGGRRDPRADDGLALSSRNGYLSEAERAEAVALSRALQQMAAQVEAGRPIAGIEAQAMETLTAARLAARLHDGAPPRRPAAAATSGDAAGGAGRGAAGQARA